MRAYGSRTFAQKPRKRGVWKWMLFFLVVGFIGGFVAATSIQARKPVELIISAPPSPEIVESEEVKEVWSESQNISVRTPKQNSIVASPLVVEGLARLNLPSADGNLGGVVVRLKDAGGRELAKVAVTGTAPDLGIHGPYRAELIFEKPKTSDGKLEVFQNSPKDGSEIDKVTIPLRFE